MFKKIPEDKSFEYKGYKIERRFHGLSLIHISEPTRPC